MTRLAAVLPPSGIPDIRELPGLPFMGCITGDATTYAGSQMGGLPDLQALAIVRAAKKIIEEELISRVVCKLPDLPRPAALDIEIVRLTAELAQIVATANQVVGNITAEVNAATAAINAKIAEINAAKDQILNTPEELRTKVELKLLERYEKYAGRLEDQISRMQTTLDCLGGF